MRLIWTFWLAAAWIYVVPSHGAGVELLVTPERAILPPGISADGWPNPVFIVTLMNRTKEDVQIDGRIRQGIEAFDPPFNYRHGGVYGSYAAVLKLRFQEKRSKRHVETQIVFPFTGIVPKGDSVSVVVTVPIKLASGTYTILPSIVPNKTKGSYGAMDMLRPKPFPLTRIRCHKAEPFTLK